MPEGHSIRRLANQWERFVGETLTLSSPQGRFAEEANLLSGTRLIATHAHGKHLFLEFEQSRYVHIHLGLYGKFTWHKTTTPPEPRPTVRLRTIHSRGALDLSGPTRCELLDEAGKQAIHARLGPDPLHPQATLEPVKAWLAKSTWPVGKTLMEQSKIAGIGNVYRAEILFILGINPHRATSAVTEAEWDRLWAVARTLLEEGTRVGRIVTTAKAMPRPKGVPEGQGFNHRTYVYKRTGQPCVVCGTPIVAEDMASRTLYWCPVCQAT